ncbi:hypothetical protein AG1IA_06205 [Rhizoctonia solani AG-1 IA]|uniref:Uncharacterized protein n=1 Tax=Thanatephorus cucumeris (strain AG1-IA) TaxID=983506 RepID=L8WP59_THACA|nr:hypothetical protein AG1IA_06205 [Rhizoctonia solani AG-1 IA]
MPMIGATTSQLKMFAGWQMNDNPWINKISTRPGEFLAARRQQYSNVPSQGSSAA